MARDFLVIGAGSAGCVVTRRLIDQGHSVTLIEAGPPDYRLDYRVHMPAALSHVLGGTTYNWAYQSLPEPGMNQRTLFCPRGKTLGGSSSINGMIYVRGHREDFDRWASLSGYESWNADSCLPFFKRVENVQFDAGRSRGDDGPMRITRGALANPLFHAFLAAGQEAGYPGSADLNGEDQLGVGPFDRTIYEGQRFSAARGYLDPIRDAANLTILTRARVLRLLSRKDAAAGGTAVIEGAEILHRGQRKVLRAAETILCAGAIDSPRILMLSGIGDPVALARSGVPVLHPLPGVGQHLQDHLEVYVQQACTKPVSIYPALKWYNQAWIGMLWYLAKKGPGATNHFEAGGFIRSDVPGSPGYPDLQLHFLPVAMSYDGTSSAGQHGFQVHVGPMKPTSRGTVSLSDNNPLSPPQLQFNYATTEIDRQVMRAGIRKVREIIAQPAFDEFRGAELRPLARIRSDAEIDAFVAAHGESAYHPCGTCRMGRDELSVVDEVGRVHGLTGIRVIDASIMPEITNGNLNAPVMMLAEKMVSAI